jgi:hypothetical protein
VQAMIYLQFNFNFFMWCFQLDNFVDLFLRFRVIAAITKKKPEMLYNCGIHEHGMNDFDALRICS